MRQKISRDANTDSTELYTTDQATTKKIRDRRVKFEQWLGEVSPANFTWGWKYQKYIYKKLAGIDKGKCRRLMVFMPPRHGKSELITVRYTAWRLLNDPGLNVILGSYNQKLADKFSRQVKRIFLSGGEKEKRSRGLLATASEWETSGGGVVRSVGVGGGYPVRGSSTTWVEPGQGGVLNHECIVYDTSQINLRYLAEFGEK